MPRFISNSGLVIDGASGVGKSCLVDQFIEGVLSKDGKERISLPGHCFHRVDSGVSTVLPRAAVIVYDITDMSSFYEAKRLVSQYCSLKTTGFMHVALAGNKADLPKQRKVKYEDAEAFVETLGIPFLEVSAKTGMNVETLSSLMAASVPAEILGRGREATMVYQKALIGGYVNVYRGRVFLIGQDRAGKTSLKKYLLGLPFDPKEESTEGIEVNPSRCEIDVNRITNWQCNSGNNTLLSDVARMLAEEWYLSFRKREKTAMDVYSFNEEDIGSTPSPKMKVRVSSEQEHFTESNDEDGDDDYAVADANGNHYDHDGSDDSDADSSEDRSGNDHDRHGGFESLEANAIKKPQLLTEIRTPITRVKALAFKYFCRMIDHCDQPFSDINMSVDIYDFAGQHLYYASHPVFLSPRAVYVLVHNLSKPLGAIAEPCVRQGTHNIILENPDCETNLEVLLSWLVTVCSIRPRGVKMIVNAARQLPYLRPPVIIVGTHADKPSEDIESMISQVQREICGKEYEKHVIRHFFRVDNTQGYKSLLRRMKNFLAGTKDTSGDDIDALRAKIMEVLRNEPYMGEKIPVRWVDFETVIGNMVAQSIHCTTVEELQTSAREICLIEDEDEFQTMFNFYHDLGLIIRHRNTVILESKWLIDLFRQLITVPRYEKAEPLHSSHWQELEKSGVLCMELIDHVFSRFIKQSFSQEDILDMMDKFGLIAKFTSTTFGNKYFVPAQLKTPPMKVCKLVPTPTDPCPLYLHFVGGFVPKGLFIRLVSSFISWCCKTWQKTPPPTLYQNGAHFVIVGEQIIYDFILLCKKSFIRIVLRQKDEADEESVSVSESIEIPSRVRVFIDDTLQKLSHELPCLGGLQYELSVACPNCLAECPNHREVACTQEECTHFLKLKEGQRLVCAKIVGDSVKKVPGMEKWLSLRRTQVQCTHKLQDRVSESDPEKSVKALNVTLLASEWGSSMGGLSTINRNLAILLAKHSLVKITLLVPQSSCSEEDRRDAAKRNIVIREAESLPGFDPLDCLSFPPKNLAVDIVLGHGAKLGKQAQVIRKSHSCKWVQVVHTAPEELGMFKNYHSAVAKGEEKNRAEVDLCRLADLVVAVGPKLRQAYSSYLRVCKKHQYIFQLTPGTFHEFSMLEQATLEEGKFKVLTFGRGDSEDFSLKGYDIAAKAVVELKDSSYCLVFVGASTGKQDEVAQNLLQTGIAKDQLIVRAFVQSKERLKELFCEVDLAIMPSRTEGFGLTALEALSAGLPILVSGNSGFAHALRDLTSGKSFVVNSNDPKEWAKAIAAVRLKGRAQRLQETQTLRASYEERYNWEEQCGSLVEKMWNMLQEK